MRLSSLCFSASPPRASRHRSWVHPLFLVILLSIAAACRGDDAPVELGDTGIVLEMDGLWPYLSGKSSRPADIPDGFRGVAIGSAKLHLPPDLDLPLEPTSLNFEDMLIGSTGFSGTITGTWSPVFNVNNQDFEGSGSGKIFGIPFGLHEIGLTFAQNSPTEIAISGSLVLPFH